MAKRRRVPAGRRRGCPCGQGADFDGCCGRVLADPSSAATAEELMRSRYTAYVRGDVEHLRATWDADTCPDDIAADPRARWTGLEVTDVVGGGVTDQHGEVAFVASFRLDGRPRRLAERSTFRRVDGQWRYVDGRIEAS